jgi:hypothetical protein
MAQEAAASTRRISPLPAVLTQDSVQYYLGAYSRAVEAELWPVTAEYASQLAVGWNTAISAEDIQYLPNADAANEDADEDEQASAKPELHYASAE